MALVAKYATTCGRCGDAISPGVSIVAMPGSGSRSRWMHTSCEPATDLFGEPVVHPDIEASDVRSDDNLLAEQEDADRGSQASAAVVQVWTDGACSGNPGPGGWAWATRDGRRGSGGARDTTNQRMEIQAALEAVRALEGPLEVISDSTYVVNNFRDGWWRGWIARGWLTSAKKPVANRDLWEPLVDEVRRRGTIRFTWVKGHSGDEMNDLVDALAVQAAKEVAR